MVLKSSKKWRMSNDFIDLNKACLKDTYPLLSIDKLVNGSSGCKYLSFMDAYSRYNQIQMHIVDEEKAAFITENANYHYKVMLFRLKNIGATFQRLMNRVFVK